MERQDLVLQLDKQQSVWEESAVFCPKDEEHGRMLPKADATTLICGKCGTKMPAKLAGEM